MPFLSSFSSPLEVKYDDELDFQLTESSSSGSLSGLNVAQLGIGTYLEGPNRFLLLGKLKSCGSIFLFQRSSMGPFLNSSLISLTSAMFHTQFFMLINYSVSSVQDS